MIREKRVLLEASDITHVRLICTKCQAGMLCSMGDGIPPPSECPACGRSWWNADTELAVPERDLIESVRALRVSHDSHAAGKTDPPRIKLQLEALDE